MDFVWDHFIPKKGLKNFIISKDDEYILVDDIKDVKIDTDSRPIVISDVSEISKCLPWGISFKLDSVPKITKVSVKPTCFSCGI